MSIIIIKIGLHTFLKRVVHFKFKYFATYGIVYTRCLTILTTELVPAIATYVHLVLVVIRFIVLSQFFVYFRLRSLINVQLNRGFNLYDMIIIQPFKDSLSFSFAILQKIAFCLNSKNSCFFPFRTINSI